MSSVDPISAWAQTVNWSAWEAVGTLGATVTALILALAASQASAAENRERENARIHLLMTITVGIRTIFAGSLTRLREEKKSVLAEATLLTASEAFDSALVALDRVDLTTLPTPRSIDWFMMVRSQIHTTKQYAAMVVGGEAGGANLEASLNNAVSTFSATIKAMDEFLQARQPTRRVDRFWAAFRRRSAIS